MKKYREDNGKRINVGILLVYGVIVGIISGIAAGIVWIAARLLAPGGW